MTAPVTVAVTGAAGQLGYALVFRLAAGDVFGPDVPVRLRLLEVPQALRAAEGVAMELDDSASRQLAGVEVTADPRTAFDGASLVMLVGARPRTAGTERRDLLEANGAIFREQGTALGEVAGDDVRVLVVGNPANTNALVAAAHAPDVEPERFSAMTRLDHNRTVAQVARRAGAGTGEVRRVTVWGNHSASQYPDIFHAEIAGRRATEVLGVPEDGTGWLRDTLVPVVAGRGAEVIRVRGASSAASAASAAIDHARDWVRGTPPEDWTSAAVVSHGEYGVPAGLVCSFPVTSDGSAAWRVVEGLDLVPFSRDRVDASVAELVEERDAVRALGLVPAGRLG